MRKTRRLAVLGAVAALTAVVTACGSPEPAVTPGAPYIPPPSAPSHSDGVTSPADTFGPACAQLPQRASAGSLNSMGGLPVATAAGPNPMLRDLVGSVRAAGLVDTLNQQKAITVFAPYDAAFDEVEKELGPQKYTALVQSKDQLGELLKYHVIAKRYDKAGLLNGQEPVATLAGGTLKVQAQGDDVTVTDGAGQTARVRCGNIPTANATVFVIDKVLMPQKP